MHSTFITPPDLLETVLIIDASQSQIRAVAEFLQKHDRPYTVYLYSEDMDNEAWLKDVFERSDIVLKARESQVSTTYRSFPAHYFGETEDLKNPVDYFTK